MRPRPKQLELRQLYEVDADELVSASASWGAEELVSASASWGHKTAHCRGVDTIVQSILRIAENATCAEGAAVGAVGSGAGVMLTMLLLGVVVHGGGADGEEVLVVNMLTVSSGGDESAPHREFDAVSTNPSLMHVFSYSRCTTLRNAPACTSRGHAACGRVDVAV
eukprot:4457328-Pyramimonas_sp.AAC.1